MIYDYLPPIEGGIENHVKYLLAYLNNCYIFFLTLQDPEYLPAYEKHGNLEIFRVPIKRFVLFRYIFSGLKLFKKVRIDLIHAHTLGTPAIVAVILGKLFHRPVVITIHESSFIINMSSQRILTRILYQLLIKSARSVITTSAELRQYALRISRQRKKIVEIPNGIDSSLFNPAIKDSGIRRKYGWEKLNVVLCPRRIAPKNGIIYLIEAIPEVIKRKNNVHFLFVGPIREENYWKLIRKRIEEMGIEKYVTFTGGVPHAEMTKYYAVSDVVVIPSLIEAISLSALEAMACKKPIVATAVGGLCEIIKNQYNGILVKPADSEALAKAILLFLNNNELAINCAENGYSTAKNFSWANVAERTLRVYYHTFTRRNEEFEAIEGF
jgi:hypothetical protein